MHDDLAKQLSQKSASFYEECGTAFSQTRHYTWNEEKVISALIKPGMTIVDVGAGNGRFARTLSDQSVTYIGLEPSASLRGCAEPTLDMRPGALPRLPLAEGLADLTVCLAVLHHIPTREERQAAVSELIRITKPGGIIAATSWYLHRNSRAEAEEYSSIVGGDPGDYWVPWNAEGKQAQRYVHQMQPQEWEALWNRPEVRIQKIGLFGKTDWVEKEEEARNWFVIANRV